MSERRRTVAVIGGGVAGCSIAYFLKKRGIENINVYEKNSEVGGCAHTRFWNGIPYEFEAQVAFTDKRDIRAIFEDFLTIYPPPNQDKKYKYLCSPHGKLKDLHPFPISMENVLKWDDAEDIIWELYNLHPEEEDHKNFEAYCISKVGKRLYERYFKNYNHKAWKKDPKEMDTEWVNFRPLRLQKKSVRFGDQWSGHPGNYNPMWEKMLEGINVINKRVELEDDLKYTVDGHLLGEDFIITTIPMSNDLEFVNTHLVFVGLESEEPVLPEAWVTFPNHYDFVRIFEYRKQYNVQAPYTLISFQFPWVHNKREADYMHQALMFTMSQIRKPVVEIWSEDRTKTYPINTSKNMGKFYELLWKTEGTNIIPLGRMGLHLYCSKDTCLQQSKEIAEKFEQLTMHDGIKDVNLLIQLRRNIH